MSDPKRWVDDEGAPQEVVEVLRTMDPPRPAPPNFRARLAGRFTDPGSPVRITRSRVFWFRTALAAASIASAAGAVATARGPLAHYFSHHVRPAEGEVIAPPAVPRPAPPTLAPEPVEPAPASPAPSASSAPASGAPSGSSRVQIRPDSLAHETMMLEEARRRMATEPLRAIRMLNLHQRRYPHGELMAERMFLRVDALARLGRTSEAYAALDALKRLFPDSAYARLAPSLITSAPPPPRP